MSVTTTGSILSAMHVLALLNLLSHCDLPLRQSLVLRTTAHTTTQLERSDTDRRKAPVDWLGLPRGGGLTAKGSDSRGSEMPLWHRHSARLWLSAHRRWGMPAGRRRNGRGLHRMNQVWGGFSRLWTWMLRGIYRRCSTRFTARLPELQGFPFKPADYLR